MVKKSTAPRRTQKKPTQAERTAHLEEGMKQMSAGITAILDRMDQQDTKPDGPVTGTGKDILDTEPVPKKVIELPPSHINLGEINFRRDLAEFIQNRVKWLDESGQRPGWTVERELEHMTKYIKKTAETAQAAEESREHTIGGDNRT